MTTIALTANTTAAPYVDVLVEDLLVGADSLTVWRTVEGRAFKVRGLVGVDASAGVATTRDYEAPAFGVESSYRVEYFDADGEQISYSAPATITLNAPGSLDVAWLHNPFDPSTSVQVHLLGGQPRTLSRPVEYETFRVPGRSVGVAVFSGARRGYERLVLDCFTTTAADEAKVESLFGGYDDDTIPIVCVRAQPAHRLPATVFAVVGSPRKMPYDLYQGGSTIDWGLEGDEVAPPPEAFVVALLDYADFTAFYTDYAAYTAAYADYTAATRDYTIAGTG